MSERVRFMRLLVMFDLPMETPAQRKNYARFRKYLVKSGYLMVQKSVYSKLALTDRIAAGLIARLRENKPSEGVVQVLKITERQYAAMECIAGSPHVGFEIDDAEALVVL